MAFLPLRLRYFPLAGVMTFLALSVALFFVGPFDWPISNHELLAVFLCAVFFSTIGGYAIGASAHSRCGPFLQWRRVYVAGAISAMIMIFPSSYVYTGKMPWDAFASLLDQGQAYRDFLARIEELEGQRGLIVIARTLTHWMIYAVIPLAAFRWSELGPVFRLLLAGAVFSALSFSLLRGTDQGTFDLTFVAASSVLIVVARRCLAEGSSITDFLRTRLGMTFLAGALLFTTATFYMFIERKVQRYEGQIASLCFGEDQQICVNPDNPLVADLDEWGRFAFGMTTAYTSQGYYGLALSLDRDFETMLGVGHSSALTRLYEAITGDREFYERSFTFRLRKDAWSDQFFWSTMYTWIANDVGFVLTVPLIGILAWIWGAAWRDAVAGGNDAAGIVFILMTQTFMYSPANFQLALVSDTYATLVIWIAIWKLTGGRRAVETVGSGIDRESFGPYPFDRNRSRRATSAHQ